MFLTSGVFPMRIASILVLGTAFSAVTAVSANAQQAPRAYYAAPASGSASLPYAGGYLGASSYQQRAYGYGLPVNPAYPPSGYAQTQAQPRTKPYDYLVFSGLEASGNNGRYGNIGIIGALGDSHFGNGPVWRGMLDALSYAYNGGPTNSTIDGSAFAGEAALGYIHTLPGGSSLAGYVGGLWRNTSNTLGLKLQGETMLYATPDWRAGATAAYIVGANDAWWVRGAVQNRPWGNFFIGPEMVMQGDSTYSAWQLGGLLNGIRIGQSSEIGLRAGYKKIENLSATGYGGAEFSTMF
jgi:hypothetical protein